MSQWTAVGGTALFLVAIGCSNRAEEETTRLRAELNAARAENARLKADLETQLGKQTSSDAADDQNKMNRAKAELRSLTRAAELFEVQFGRRAESLSQLIQPPGGKKPFLEASHLRDPWGLLWQYDPAGAHNSGIRPDIWTVTLDGTMIGNWPS